MPQLNDWKTFRDFACNGLTDEMRAFLKENMGANCFLVTGASGAGKSSFIKCITGEEVYVGSNLRSGTTTFSIVPAIIEGKRCMFLDMPGFNTDDFDDWEIFFLLIAAMAVIEPYVQFRGVLFVDRMNDPRLSPAATKIINWLSCFCGNDYMPNVTVVTTCWDGLDQDGIDEKLERVGLWMESECNKDLFGHGCGIYHHGLVQDNGTKTTLHRERRMSERKSRAKRMIVERYSGSTPFQLQAINEIANGASIQGTAAGKLLMSYDPNRHTPGASEGYESSDSSGSSEPKDHKPSTGSSGFNNSLKELKPWIDLLVNAAKIYQSFNSVPGFQVDPPFFSTSEGAWGFGESPFFGDFSSSFNGFS